MSDALLELLTRGDVAAFNAQRGERSKLDLFAADLAEAQLPDVDLSNAVLDKADLTNAVLSGAQLLRASAVGIDATGAKLDGALALRAKLREAYLDGANLDGADLSQADLAEAVLERSSAVAASFAQARLHGVAANGARWPEAELSAAKLYQAKFEGADLSRADLTDATAAEASFAGATLDGIVGTGLRAPSACFDRASLRGATLRDANLDAASLVGACLAAADLTGANLASANLTGADLSGASLAGASLDGALLDGVNWQGADLTGVDVVSLGLSEADVASLSAHGVPYDAAAPWVLAGASFSRSGDRVAAVWINQDDAETRSARWAVWSPSGRRDGGVPLAADAVVDAQVVALGEGFVSVWVRQRADGLRLEDFRLDGDGPARIRSVALGYEPLARPVARVIDGTLWLWGLARRGPTIVVHRYTGADGFEVVSSKAVATATGFLPDLPLLVGKGDVLTPVGVDGVGEPRRAPEGFPGIGGVAGPHEDGLLCLWGEARRGDAPGGVRFAAVARRGAPSVESVSLSNGVVAVGGAWAQDGLVAAWVERDPKGGSTVWRCQLPAGAPVPLLSVDEPLVGLRVGPDWVAAHAASRCWVVDPAGTVLAAVP